MISVIIPIYNAAPYLRRTIGSVLRSAFEDLELILVDDGSTDGGRSICTEYAKRDRRVKVLSQENSGVSTARNRGLEVCRGEWVVFVDADDCISPDFLTLIAGEEDADLLLFDFAGSEEALTSGPRTEKVLRYGPADMPGLAERILAPRQLRENGHVNFRSSNGKAFKRTIVQRRGLRFSPELSYGEDKLFNLEYALQAENYTYFPVPAYFYETHSGSLSQSLPPELLSVFMLLMEKLWAVLDEAGQFPAMEGAYAEFALNFIEHTLNNLIFNPSNPNSRQERYSMCARLHRSPVCHWALKRNLRYGHLQRKVHLLAFDLGWYHAVDALCAFNHARRRKRGSCLPK
ncbi:MAG: glycosyltransferase family 2 protein [Oscillibacter sp.]|nr:glycosyltransferase family 2 protein [Oscillibacter sp.]